MDNDGEIDRRARELTEALSGYKNTINKPEVKNRPVDCCTSCDNCKHSQIRTNDYNYCKILRGNVKRNTNFCINHSDYKNGRSKSKQ